MKNHWLTLLANKVDFWEIDFKDFCLKQLSTDLSEDTKIYNLECTECMEKLSISITPVTSFKGKEFIKKTLADLEKVPVNRESTSVKDFVNKVKLIAYSNLKSNDNCDCEFRAHQAAAIDEYLWYVDGKGFADEVSEWLEL